MASPINLPSSLNLPPHLSAQKYFLVCTLTVAAWDTLVLSPRTWRLLKTPGWPALKVLFHFLRVFMPLEFVVVGENILKIIVFSCSSQPFSFQLSLFSTLNGPNLWVSYLLFLFFPHDFSPFQACQKFFLFEPICTAILLAAASGRLPLISILCFPFWRFPLLSAVHVIRIHAIYDMNRSVLLGMSALFAVQVVVTAVSCAFYRCIPGFHYLFVVITYFLFILAVPLLDGQGCIAGPKQNWVGIYWVAPTLLYTLSVSMLNPHPILY